MSYILEALKQAQHHRDGQRVPDLGANHVKEPGDATEEYSEKPSRIALWPVAILGIAVLAASGAGLWLRSHDASPEHGLTTLEGAVNAQPAPDSGSTDPGTAEGATSNQEFEIEVPSAIDLAGSVNTDAPKSPGTETKAKKLQTRSSTSAGVTELSAAGNESDKLAAISRPIPETATSPAIHEPALPVTKINGQLGRFEEQRLEAQSSNETIVKFPEVAPADNVDQLTNNRETTATPLPYDDIPDYRQLPRDIQEKIEAMEFTVHLYSPIPARRMVKINGILRREGNQLSEGFILDEITPTGVIVAYDNGRFSVSIR